ncbi:serine/threonine protein kinase TAO2 [Encephalitozoon hellem]|uniref:Serine/threonine protein kinase TAO2 n=2 Tax=Encephalitozoon hellem TaxID=27973 RepID=A0A9Q9C442_ENCHE|nr:serine/threonine protein kinase TAO2 [Encephalitozoon hellem]
MTESLRGYKEVRVVRRDKRTTISCAVDMESGERVVLESVDLSGFSEDYQPLLMNFLLNHSLNHSPYVMKVLKVFEEEGRIYVVQKHMSLGPVDRFIRDQILLSDDFIFYVFMQIVYAMKINGDEGWFWDRMSPRYIWIDEDGKVRICWADVILGNMKGVGEYVGRWSGCGNDVSLKSKADGESISFGNLRRIFVELALNPSQSYRMACSSEDLQDLSLLGRKESLSPVLDGFASLLFEERGRMSDLEDYTRRMIQEKRIASNPREILGALKVIIEETNRTDGFSTLEEMKMKENSGEASKIEDSESTGGSEEGSKSVSGSRVDDERVESFGTREYKRGRFHVCEAVPLGEREKGLQMSEHMKRMVRVVNAQSRQIGLLTKALRQSGLLDKEMDEEIGELEELAGFLLFGMERQ